MEILTFINFNVLRLKDGGKVSNLLDKEENPSIGSIREVTNERFNKLDFKGCYPADER